MNWNPIKGLGSQAETAHGRSTTQAGDIEPQFPEHPLWTERDEIQAVLHKRIFPSEKYIRGSQAGQGGWSTVWKVLRVSDGRVLAGKGSSSIQQVYRESKILRRLSHPHILEFMELYKVVDNEDATLLITEFCARGTLQTRIDRADGAMKRQEGLQVTMQIADALAYLHGRDMYHSDVKPRNILIRSFNPINVVLADCADVKVQGRKFAGPMGGTHLYWSPEMLASRQHCGCGDDVWALGISFLGMVGQWPQIGSTKHDVSRYPRRCFAHVRELREVNGEEHGVVALLVRMLAWKAGERISAEGCGERVRELLGIEWEVLEQGVGGWGIRAPEGFHPISFW